MKTKKSSVGIFIAMMISLLMISDRSFSQNTVKTDTIKIQTSAQCGMCKSKIEEAVSYVKGVKEAALDLETKVVTVVYRTDKTDADKIRQAISNVGYDADTVPADPEAYEKLSPCCKKGGME